MNASVFDAETEARIKALPPENYEEERSCRVASMQDDGHSVLPAGITEKEVKDRIPAAYDAVIYSALARMPNFVAGNYDKIQFRIKEHDLVQAASKVVDIFFQSEMLKDPSLRVNADGQPDVKGFQPFPVLNKNDAQSIADHDTINKLSKMVLDLRLRDGKEPGETRFSYVLKEEFDKALADPEAYVESAADRGFGCP